MRTQMVSVSLELRYCFALLMHKGALCVAGRAFGRGVTMDHRGKLGPRRLRLLAASALGLTCSSRPRARRSASAAVSACHFAYTGGEHHQYLSNAVFPTVADVEPSIAVHQGGASDRRSNVRYWFSTIS